MLSLIHILGELKENSRKMEEKIDENNRALREELKGNYQETMKKLDEHKESLKEEWNNKMEINNRQLQEEWDKKLEEPVTEIKRVESETKEKCERMNQEILSVREETNGRIENIRTNQAVMGERLEGMSTSLNRVQDQTTAHRDEIISLKNRPVSYTHLFKEMFKVYVGDSFMWNIFSKLKLGICNNLKELISLHTPCNFGSKV